MSFPFYFFRGKNGKRLFYENKRFLKKIVTKSHIFFLNNKLFTRSYFYVLDNWYFAIHFIFPVLFEFVISEIPSFMNENYYSYMQKQYLSYGILQVQNLNENYY